MNPVYFGSPKRTNPEVAFTVLMQGSRNDLLPEPFDEFDPHHRISGRKLFNTNVRALKSKINLTNELVEVPKR